MDILIKKNPRYKWFSDHNCFKYKISEVENKIPDISSTVTTTVLNTKISKVENKIPDHAKFITTQEFNKLIADNFKERLKQANLVCKADFDNKLISFNRKIPRIKKNI